MTALLTMLVPTCNRYPFLARLLRYYHRCGMPYPLHILDSSDVSQPPAEVMTLIRQPQIQYVKHPTHSSLFAKLCEGLRDVRSPYVVLWADDDLMVPESCAEGVGFLERHDDYSVVHGESGLFRVAAQGQARRIQWIAPYLQRSVTDQTAAGRLLNHFSGYSVLFYSVHRTAQLQQHMALCRGYEFGYGWAELALGGLAVIQGKAKKLNRLYMLREAHDGMDSLGSPGRQTDVFDWITGAEFADTCQRFQRCLAAALAQHDSVDESGARDVVKRALWVYLARALTRKWQSREQHAVSAWRNWIREAARGLPVLRRGWRFVHAAMPGLGSTLSLEALSHPRSPYHVDFLPMEWAVSESVC